MKTVGIIGGLGPETTSRFYLELTFGCQAKSQTNRPKILIYSVPIPYEVEKDAILKGIGEERIIPLLIEAAKCLESAGADFIVMPCNSLHAFIENLRASVRVPVLSIVEETTKFIKNKKIKEVGILSTSITQKKKLYENSFTSNGISCVIPTDAQQNLISKIIHNTVISKSFASDKNMLIKIIDDIAEKGTRHVVLACTDLQLLLQNHPQVEILDTMKIFSNVTTREILK